MAWTEMDDDVLLSPELEAQIDAALLAARDPDDEEVALSAYYDRNTDAILLRLKTGQRLVIPREDLQGLAGADPAEVANMEILSPGVALHWEALNADFLISELTHGVYGNARWMRDLPEYRRRNGTAALLQPA